MANSCLHLHRVWTEKGSYHFSEGCVWDDILAYEVCIDCGEVLNDCTHDADDEPDYADLEPDF